MQGSPAEQSHIQEAGLLSVCSPKLSFLRPLPWRLVPPSCPTVSPTLLLWLVGDFGWCYPLRIEDSIPEPSRDTSLLASSFTGLFWQVI